MIRPYEKRIGAVFRGPGPRGLNELKWGSFDGHLLALATRQGANVRRTRVEEVRWDHGRPIVRARSCAAVAYDLLVVASGVNSVTQSVLQALPIAYRPPQTTKTLIREYYLGEDTVNRVLGTSMHVFMLDLPRLEFAAIIPKGDYASVCLLGEEIDGALIRAFFESPQVKACFPPAVSLEQAACQCQPRINIAGALQPFGDRIVFIGDSGVTRLYKDGIGAAYRTAKAAATTVVFEGIGARDFQRRYLPACQAINRDNRMGKLIFCFTQQIQHRSIARSAVLRMTRREQQRGGSAQRMSMVLWDMFTGSAPYSEILGRMLHPAFWLRLASDVILSALGRPQPEDGGVGTAGGIRTASESITGRGELGRVYQPGDILIRQGEMSDEMFVIQEGQVALVQEQGGQEVFLGVRGAGEFLGVSAIFEKQEQTATVRALTLVRLLTVDKENFMKRVHQDPAMAYRLFQHMSRRVRELNQQVKALNQELDRVSEGRRGDKDAAEPDSGGNSKSK